MKPETEVDIEPRPKLEVLKEIRQMLIERFKAYKYIESVHYTISKENYTNVYFDITLPDALMSRREQKWQNMLTSIKECFGTEIHFSDISAGRQQVRLDASLECEARRLLPKPELVFDEKDSVVETESVTPSVPIPVPVPQKPQAAERALSYNKSILNDLYMRLYMTIQTETKLHIGKDFSVTRDHHNVYTFVYKVSKRKGASKFSLEDRYALAKACIETCFGEAAVIPCFTVQILSVVPGEEIQVNLEGAYKKMLNQA